MRPVRYGIVGFGQISRKAHVPELLSNPEAEIVAVATSDPEKHEQIRSMIGADVRVYPSCRRLLQDREVEAVVIATPNWLHREQAIDALDAGKHVLYEKPLGVDLDECAEIISAEKRNTGLLQVGHEFRSSDLTRSLKNHIDRGAIGEPRFIVISEHRKPLLPGWRQGAGTGGIMLEKNSHFFDLFNWIAAGEPVSVQGIGGNVVNSDSPLLDHCVVTIRYDSGAVATLLMCLFAEYGSQQTVDVAGSEGRIIALE